MCQIITTSSLQFDSRLGVGVNFFAIMSSYKDNPNSVKKGL